jgi:dTDP-D-glucose 4,6-dehydratase
LISYFVYAFSQDIVDGVVRALDRPMGYKIFNLGNGRPYLLKNFISLVERCVGKKASIQLCPEQPGDVDRTCADISSAAELLGYNPTVTFEEGIELTVEWYRAMESAGHFQLTSEERAEKTLNASGGGLSRFKRHASDLELSSYVQKAPKQLTQRMERVFYDGSPDK